MSKRNKKSRSVLKLEALEQRQLLASIVSGSGTEVNSDVTLANGNTYDQILLTGSSVTVTADTVAGVHQVTRVDFLDADGDIVRAEFSGAGTLKVDLADFKEAAAPTEYNTTTKYVQGNATFTIVGSDETTNFSVFSLGSANVNGGANSKLFDGGKDGGNNSANVAALVVQDNGTVLGNAFGRIGAGNAVFSAQTGAVGIIAPKIQFQSDIIVGDIDAKGNAVGQLRLGDFSSNKTVTVAGGDLKQTTGSLSGTAIANVAKIISTSGSNSFGVIANTSIIDSSVGVAAADISYKSSAEKVTINGQTATQADLDVYKTKFLNEVEITGGLKEGLTFAALMMGKVTVGGDLAGLITTDVDGDNVSDTNELSIGNVEIAGDILAKGAIEASTSIGNITVAGGIDYTDLDGVQNAGAQAVISTIGRASFSAAIGTVAFTGDVNFDNETNALVLAATANDKGVALAASGGIGNISANSITAGGADIFISTLKGSVGSIKTTEALDLSAVVTASVVAEKSIGAIEGTEVTLAKLGSGENVSTITSTDGDLTLGVISATKTVGNIKADGALTIGGTIDAAGVGNLSSGGALTVSAKITSTEGIGTITATEGTLKIDAALKATKDIGAITATKGALDINATIDSTAGSIGNLTVGGGTGVTLDIGAAITANKNIGAISVSGKANDLVVSKLVKATTGSIGNISVNGTGGADITISGTGAFWAKTTMGNVTVAGGGITGTDASVEFTANKIGNVSVTGDKATASLLTDIIFAAVGTDEDTVTSASIGNITLNSAANAAGVIATATNKSTTASTGTGFSSSGNIGNISITTNDTGSIVESTSNKSNLIFRAGNSNMGLDNVSAGDFASGVDEDGGVIIGDVVIKANLSNLEGNGAGAGLVIAGSVNVATAGAFVSGDGTSVAGLTKIGTSSIGTVTIQDLQGAVSVDGFSSSKMATAATFTGANVIIADTIGKITVTSGTAFDPVTPAGPLKGIVDVTDNGATADDLYIVVL